MPVASPRQPFVSGHHSASLDTASHHGDGVVVLLVRLTACNDGLPILSLLPEGRERGGRRSALPIVSPLDWCECHCGQPIDLHTVRSPAVVNAHPIAPTEDDLTPSGILVGGQLGIVAPLQQTTIRRRLQDRSGRTPPHRDLSLTRSPKPYRYVHRSTLHRYRSASTRRLGSCARSPPAQAIYALSRKLASPFQALSRNFFCYPPQTTTNTHVTSRNFFSAPTAKTP